MKKIQIKKNGFWLDLHPEGQEVPAYRFDDDIEANEMLDMFYPALVDRNKNKKILRIVNSDTK